MRIGKTILGGAAAAALIAGSLLGTAGSAAAATKTNDPGNQQQECNSLLWNLNSDQATLHFWQMQRVQDLASGIDPGPDDEQIAATQNAISQDIQQLGDWGC
jgi:NAD(P)H-hydrate repair Nnr-like enzyme with NAD(P)H-hydrate dehydratase domain